MEQGRAAMMVAEPAFLFDLTDLHLGAGTGPLTGINRVGLAYLEALLAQPAPVFGHVTLRSQVLLLDRPALQAYVQHLQKRDATGPIWWRARLLEWGNLPRARSLTFLHGAAFAKCRTRNLSRMLTKLMPAGAVWIAIGHANVNKGFLARLSQVAGLRIALMIHDTIQIDFPEFCEKGADGWFRQRLQVISQSADLVIYNSDFSRARAEHHLGKIGRVPDGIVSHLGVTPLIPDAALLPAQIDFNRPTFVILGTIEPRKNHALLLDLWDRFAAEQAAGDPRAMPQLLILGRRGWRYEAVFRRLDDSPLVGTHIHEISGLPDGGVAAVLCKSRALLFPSFVEGFGLPALEAALLHCPVFANDLTVYREFLGDWPAYAPIRDAERWADLVRQASVDPAPARPELPSTAPTWESHFAKVLPRLEKLWHQA